MRDSCWLSSGVSQENWVESSRLTDKLEKDVFFRLVTSVPLSQIPLPRKWLQEEIFKNRNFVLDPENMSTGQSVTKRATLILTDIQFEFPYGINCQWPGIYGTSWESEVLYLEIDLLGKKKKEWLSTFGRNCMMFHHKCYNLINPLHPNISVHILHTVLYTFTKVLMRRTCLIIKSFFSWWSFPLLSWH